MALPDAAKPGMWHIRKQGMKTARCPKIITNKNLKATEENSSSGGGMSRRKTLGELWLKGLGMLLHRVMAKLGLCCLSVVPTAKAGMKSRKNKPTSLCDCHPQNTAPSSPSGHYPGPQPLSLCLSSVSPWNEALAGSVWSCGFVFFLELAGEQESGL